MVRLKEIRDKLRPNASFRSWQASHTFGGTTKSKPLYIAGFRRKSFYYIAGLAATTVLVGGVTGGVGVRGSLRNAKDLGQAEGALGQLVETSMTQTRIRTLTSDGLLILTTVISSFITTAQRGGGVTVIRTTGADGEIVTILGAITFVTNSDNKIQQKTLVGSTYYVTETDGVTVPTTVYGAATTVTETDGDVVTVTMYSELTVLTEADGDLTTSLRSQSRNGAGEATTSAGTPSTSSNPSSTVNPSSSTASSSSISSTGSPTVATSSSPSSTSVSTSSSSTGGAGGGSSFSGEGTFYTPGVGSCGTDNSEAEFVAALSRVLFDATGIANPNNNPYCGRRALVKAAGSGSRRRLLQRGAMTEAETTRTFYTGNSTCSRNELLESRSQKESRRLRIRSQLGIGPERPLKLSPRLGSPSGHILPTPVIMQDSSSATLIAPPMITPPPPNRSIDIYKRQAGGGGVTVTIVDRCPVCAQYDLDLSPAAFDVIGDQDAGRIAIEWSWLD